MKESLRYFENAKEILGKSPIEDDRYEDIKYVQEACGVAYLAILKAIDEYMIKKGVNVKELPQSVDGYRKMLKKYISIHNGKLYKSFDALYIQLHIAGYYRGLLVNVGVIKDVLKSAKAFIEKIGKEA